MTKRRIVTWLAGFNGLCVILLAAAVFLLPRLLDSQAIREKIRAFLLARTNGNVVIERIDLTWFPRPVVVARGASLARDSRIPGTIETIEVYPPSGASWPGAGNELTPEAPVPSVLRPSDVPHRRPRGSEGGC